MSRSRSELQDFENYAPPGSAYLAFAAPWSLYNSPHMGVPGYQGTSSTWNSIGTSTKTFIVQPGKGFAAGRRAVALINGQWSHNMEGDVASYDGQTGRLVVRIDPSRVVVAAHPLTGSSTSARCRAWTTATPSASARQPSRTIP